MQRDMLLDTVSKTSVNQPLISTEAQASKNMSQYFDTILDTVTNIFHINWLCSTESSCFIV